MCIVDEMPGMQDRMEALREGGLSRVVRRLRWGVAGVNEEGKR